MNKLFLCLLAFLFLLTPRFLFAGTIVLKNGHVINGKIIASDEEKVIMTWGNGRTTIYHRFIESVVLSKDEEQYILQYRSPKNIQASNALTEEIQLPDFEELHGEPVTDLVEVDPEPSDLVSTELVVDPVLDDSSIVSSVKKFPNFEQRVFTHLSFSMEVPENWSVSDSENSIKVQSPNGGVMISLDRYSGGELADDRAAAGLLGKLEEHGFKDKRNGFISLIDHLGSVWSRETTTLNGSHDCVHALILPDSDNSKMLISVYRDNGSEEISEGLLTTVLSSLIPIQVSAQR